VSVTAVRGFVAAGVACGIKPSGDPDLALIATEGARAVPAAAVFTSNKAAAAPVAVSRAHLQASGSKAAAVVLNSGNANAATGAKGNDDAERTCAAVGEHLGCGREEVLVCSTGLIGFPLPMPAVEAGVAKAAAALSPDGGEAAADAIRTTDTFAKQTRVEVGPCLVGGMAKGAAMLAPDMATMLAVLTTNAAAHPTVLHAALTAAVADSFNALSVDGCTSTNDTVVVIGTERGRDVPLQALQEALALACADLAGQMAADAEGATKTVRVKVRGAHSTEEARRAARRVAESQLVKCSLHGEDPYWGRIVSELGSAGVHFEPEMVEIAYGGVTVCEAGVAVDHDAAEVARHLAQRDVEVTADLGVGSSEAVVLTNDLSPAYIEENKRTS
jgi:glutamate N-acetyltransferase/amino-acid N-acetyltransferase